MFTYDAGSATDSAATLAVNPSITASQLAPVETGPPLVSSGLALLIWLLSPPPARSMGRILRNTSAPCVNDCRKRGPLPRIPQATAQQSMLTQAQNLRQQLSGVSLDEEAIRLVQLQRSYQASSRIVSVIDQLAQSLMDIQ